MQSVSVSAYNWTGVYWNRVNQVATDINGDYDIANLADGTYRVEFDGCNYGYIKEYYNDQLSIDLAQDISINAGQTVTNIDASLAVGGRIQGWVTASDGVTPLESMGAYAMSWNGSYWYTVSGDYYTDENGNYDICCLPSGTYSIQFSDGGYNNYLTEYYNNKSSADLADGVAVIAGQTVTGIDGSLALSGHIKGKVTASDGTTPIQNIIVRVFIWNGSSWSESSTMALTDANGNYDITGLAAGNYRVQFRDNSNQYATEYYNNKSNVNSADSINVNEGETVNNINASLSAPSHIKGKVTAADGTTPIQNINVRVYSWNGSSWTSVDGSTDVNGDYDITGLSAGTYRVGFFDIANQYATEYYNNKSSVNSADDITLTSGETRSNINASLILSSHIKGKVTAPDGTTPLAGVEVNISLSSLGSYWLPSKSAITDVNGDYDISGITPDTYKAVFIDGVGMHISEYYNNQSDGNLAQNIIVGDGQTVTGINASLELGGNVSGKVTGPDGITPLTLDAGGVGVLSWNGSGWQWIGGGNTDANGNYTTSGVPTGANYRIQFRSYSGIYVNEYYNDKSSAETGDAVAITAGQTTNLNASLALAGHIQGKVTKADGTTPIQGIRVIAYKWNASKSFWSNFDIPTVYTDANGDYNIGGLGTDDYKVEFYDNTGQYATEYYNNRLYMYEDVNAPPTIEFFAHKIAVTAGQTVNNINASLSLSSSIQGKVTGPDGTTPLQNIQVLLCKWFEAESYSTCGFRWAKTDANGNYTIDRILEGTYKLWFQDNSGQYFNEHYDNQAVTNLAQDIVLTPGQTLTNINASLASVAGGSGSLKVDILPAEAVTAGAKWNVDGGAWQDSGATVANLNLANHTVTFSDVADWTKPSSQSVAISDGQTTTTTGTYTQEGSLTVTISPAGAVTAGAKWNVDNGAWQNSGATVAHLSIGNHTVSFKSTSGWITPSNQTASIQNNQTSTLTATYTAEPPPPPPPPILPVVTTGSASSIYAYTATLNGTIGTIDPLPTLYFEYGTTTAYGSTASNITTTLNGTSIEVSANITGLNPGWTYHFRLVATNNSGTRVGLDQTFTTPQVAKPTVTTGSATSITSNSATLDGTVNPNGYETNCYFEYGTTMNNGSPTEFQNKGSGIVSTTATVNLTYLNLNTTYYYRIVATNSGGTTYGEYKTFTTSAILPVATTQSASSIKFNAATLNAYVITNNAATTCYFEYGTTTGYGSQTNVQNVSANSSGTSITANITGLTVCDTTYHFRIVATNSAGTVYGEDNAFTITRLWPSVTTNIASGVTSNSATLNGTLINPTGCSITYYFEYDTTTNYRYKSKSYSSGSGFTNIEAIGTISDLIPNTTYHFRLVAYNIVGSSQETINGNDQVFTTLTKVPTVILNNASSITTNSASLNGTITPNGEETKYHFEYGTTTSYGYSTPEQSAGSGLTPIPVKADITGLTPNTTYHFKLIASNIKGQAQVASDNTVYSMRPFTTEPIKPYSETNSASEITATSAVLNGIVNPNRAETYYYFLYDKTIYYNQYDYDYSKVETKPQYTDAGYTNIPVKISITELEPNTEYSFKIIAINKAGEVQGSEQRFTTLGVAPVVTTEAATSIEAYSANLNGRIDTYGIPNAEYYFEYGLTTNYGTTKSYQNDNGYYGYITGLIPNTTYHFRFVGKNSVGTSTGVDKTFTTPADIPKVTINDAASITAHSAKLSGTVNPNGAETKWYFEYGPNYGQKTTIKTLSAGTNPVKVTADLSGLLPGTSYPYRLVAINSKGTTCGTSYYACYGQKFTTPAKPPTVITGSVNTTVQSYYNINAELSGSVNSNGAATTCYFEYGITDKLGAKTPDAGVADSTYINTIKKSYSITNLSPVTTYYYRLVAQNEKGTTYGDVRTFITPATQPNVKLNPATDITADDAKISGTVNPNGDDTTWYFEYRTGHSTFIKTSVENAGSGIKDIPVAFNLTGLTPVTTYEYYLVATNSKGTARDFKQFTTPAKPPAVTTGGSSSSIDIDTASAYIYGSINANGANTKYYFEYGKYDYTDKTVIKDLSASISTTNVSANIYNLTPDSTYRYRLVAENIMGKTEGEEKTFRTPAIGVPKINNIGMSDITGDSARLKGKVLANYANKLPTTCYIEYGTSITYGEETGAVDVNLKYGGTVDIPLTGLMPNTTYYYRIVATNENGTTYGANWSFTTLKYTNPPTSITVPKSSDTGYYTILWGASSTSGAIYLLQEATDSSFTQNLLTIYGGSNTSFDITGRTKGYTYYYRVKVVGTNGYADSKWVVGANGVSIQKETGSLTVYIEPSEAANAGAKWRLNGSGEYNSGDSINNLITGDHYYLVDFFNTAVNGWIPPKTQWATIESNKTTTITGIYSRDEQKAILEGFVVSNNKDAIMPLSNAWVKLYSNNMMVSTKSTDSQGKFKIETPPGIYSVIAEKYGYLPNEITVNLNKGETISKNFLLTEAVASNAPTFFNFKSSVGNYCFPGMKDITFEVMVSWNGSSGSAVEFLIAGQWKNAIVTNIGEGEAKAELKVSEPLTILSCSQLIAKATNGEGAEGQSSGSGIYFNPIGTSLLWYNDEEDDSLWETSLDLSGSIKFFEEKDKWEFNLPLATDAFELKAKLEYKIEMNFQLSTSLLNGGLVTATVNGDLSGSGGMEFQLPSPNPKLSIIGGAKLGIEGELVASRTGCEPWSVTPSWGFSLSGKTGISSPAVLLLDAVSPGLGSSLANIPKLDKITLELYLSPNGSLSGEYLNGGKGECLFKSDSTKGSLGAGLGIEGKAEFSKETKAGVFMGGDGKFKADICPDFKFKGFTGKISAKAYAEVYFFEANVELVRELNWDFDGNSARTLEARSHYLDKAPENLNWQPIGKSSLKWGHANRMPASNKLRSKRSGYFDEKGNSGEEILVENLTWSANPSILLDGNKIKVLYTMFDTDKPWYESSDIAEVVIDENSALSINRITNDNASELYPRVHKVDEQSHIAAWSRVNGDISNTKSPEEVMPYLEIVASFYDSTSNSWGTPAQLTDNTVADRKPMPVSFGTQKGVLWIQNEAGAMVGNSTYGDSLMYSSWNGSGWDSPVKLWSGKKGIIDYAFVNDSQGECHVVLNSDEDGNEETQTDLELYHIKTVNGVWQQGQNLTNNGIEDNLPLLVSADGNPVLVWSSDSTLMYSSLSVWNPKKVYIYETVSSSPTSLDGVSFPGGAAIAYSVQGSEGMNIFAAFYDSALDQWSLPRQLTYDGGAESSISLAFDGKEIVMSYLKTQTLRNDVEVVVNGQKEVIKNVPSPGRTDIYMLRHALGYDLGITEDSLVFDPVNPAPGSTANIKLTVENKGDMIAQNVLVKFYDGDPNLGGTAIGQSTISSIIAGDSKEVSISWVLPSDLNSHKIFAVVDPELTFEDRDRTNNTISVWSALPDITVVSGETIKLSDTKIAIISKIINNGVTPSGQLKVNWHLENEAGAEIGFEELESIAPGASRDCTVIWDRASYKSYNGLVKVYTVADADNSLAESNESNNSSFVIINEITESADAPAIIVLTDITRTATVESGIIARVYGSSGINTINVASGAKVECNYFPGANQINIQDSTSKFTVKRSGATVYLSSGSGTFINIPATKTPQTLRFADGSSTLIITDNKAMIGSQEITLTETQLQSPENGADTSSGVF